jgi:putative methyltransferase (TIGR04325 family)
MKSAGFYSAVPEAIRSMRISQIRGLARVLIFVGRTSRLGGKLVSCARDNRITGPILQWLLAFHGTFSNLADAKACAARYVPASHEHPIQIDLHAKFAETTRASDYPVLFFLAPFASELRTVFDLGGSIGNLFFQLDRYLKFDDELVWAVHDLPIKKQATFELAKAKSEKRIIFTEEFSSASGVDLFIVAGALHYFEPSLADLLSNLASLPKHVIVNRSPFSSGKEIFAVQDGGLWLNACKVHNVERLISGMHDLRYELVDSWPAERMFRIPLVPEYSETYRGFYFRLLEHVQDKTIKTADLCRGHKLSC